MTSPPSRAIDTVFLDAGGVLVHPNWARVAAALTARGVATTAAALTAAEPHAKREMDLATLMARTDDRQRGWTYFESVLRHAGLDASTPAATEALAEVRAYHDVHNVWEHVPDDVVPMLARLRALDLRLVVVSNANGRLHTMFDRVGLTPHVDVVLDSHHFGVEKPDPRLCCSTSPRSTTTPIVRGSTGWKRSWTSSRRRTRAPERRRSAHTRRQVPPSQRTRRRASGTGVEPRRLPL